MTTNAGMKAGIKEKSDPKTALKLLNLKMSRAGLEPATHWLKASSGHFE
jgi:hypothetical protein